MPSINGSGSKQTAMWNRLCVIKFSTKFANNLTEAHEKKRSSHVENRDQQLGGHISLQACWTTCTETMRRTM